MATIGYITFEDLLGTNRFFRSFGEQFYGSNGTFTTDSTTILGEDINFAFNEINDELRSTGRFSVLPIQRDSEGNFPQSLKNWNAYQVIFSKLMSDFAGESQEIPETIAFFGSRADRFGVIIKNAAAIFNGEIDLGELGIGQQVNGTIGSISLGTFHNNYRGFPFGDTDTEDMAFGLAGGQVTARNLAGAGFLGNDYPRNWTLEIITNGTIGDADFIWSKNSGVTIEGTIQSDEKWQHLEDNVWVRFEPNLDGTSHLSVGDKWNWQTVPTEIRRTFGEHEAIIGRSNRGF